MKPNVRAIFKALFPPYTSIFCFLKEKAKGFPLQSGLNEFCLFCSQSLGILGSKLQSCKVSNFYIYAKKPATYNLLSIFFSLFSIFYFLTIQNSYSQDTIKRPKIGLVLSGGGAKGFAHIGVLKVIEEAGIKIDYIGGTSMGAVVGGLYASGYNASQIDSIFKNTNFDELIQDYTPRSSKSFYEKHNDELYAISLPFKKFSVGMPVALSKGMYNYNLLTRLTNNVRHVRDFNKLPIPFVCIATDIEAGKEVVLNSGYLPQAMLASSAFPSLFSPVELNGKMLIDGGVTNNYPVEEVRKMGADIIIGVDVQDDLKNRNDLTDATKVLVQISNLEMIAAMKEKRKLTDIYIKPDITSFSVISFDQGKKIIYSGEEAAFSVYEELKALGNKDTFKPNYIKKGNDSITINQITINDLTDYTRSYVIGKLGFKRLSKITYADLKTGINKLNATQNFSAISYQLNPFQKGDELNLQVKESPNHSFIKFGLHYDGLYKSALLVNLTQKKWLYKNDVVSLDVGLGDNFRYNLDYYIDNGFYFSFGFQSRYNQFSKNVSTDFSNGGLFTQLGINSLNINYSDFTNIAYIQTVYAQKFLVGTGLELKHIKIQSNTLNNTSTPSVFDNSDYLSVFEYIKYDSYDNKYFPKRGWHFNSDLQTFLYSTNFSNQFNRFSIAKADAGFAKTFYKKYTFKLQSEAGFSFGKSSVPFLDFFFGGYGFASVNNIKPFYGYDFLSLAANSYIKSSATADVEFYKKNHLNFSANIANIEDNLFRTGNWFSLPKHTGFAVGYGLETSIGPIEVKYSWSPELNKGFTWFSIGFWF